MGRDITITVEGLVDVQRMFKDLGVEFTTKQSGDILRAGGKEVIRAAKKKVPFKGQVGRLLKKDLVVSRTKGAGTKVHVLLGPAFREKIGNQKVAVVAQHMTEGFNQKPRQTGKGKQRGVVKDQLENAVLRGYDSSSDQRNSAMNKEIQRKLNKVKSKHKNVII